MIKRKFVLTACGAAGFAALLMTAGCTGGGEPAVTSTTATSTTSATPSPSAPDGTAPASDGSADTGAANTGATSSPPADSDSDTGTARCLTPDLAGALEAVEGGASAGRNEVAIVLTNEASTPCVLQGWPGVSFVGDDNGTQIGAAATLDRSSPHGSVLLDPGSAAQAVVSVANAQNYDEDCEQAPADGFRVYPPGETRSLFVHSDQITLTACANPDDELLDVQAFQPGS
ncbi:DUF4232 domain-containing protein [Promicromonospora sp. Populi]|uniref:DUF4232 domain-containing protein n=1 Tax=Promicromonospora sp. Populi TaxID=3239420 RepID=UPI0034E28827